MKRNEHLDHLLQRHDQLRYLAFHFDPESGEDLLQDTWIKILSRPPQNGSGLRTWAARVMSNVRRDRLKAEARRSQPDRRDDGRAAEEPADQGMEREELLELVRESVERLKPHYREVLDMQYFQGLDPAEIAERLSLPIKTVRTRSIRARGHLRADLERRAAGDVSYWSGLGAVLLGFLASLLPKRDSHRLALAAGTVAAGSMLVLALQAGPGSPDQRPLERDSTAARADGADIGVVLVPPSVRESLPVFAPVVQPLPTPVLAGRVVDVTGKPVAAVEVYGAARMSPRTTVALTTTDANGEFLCPNDGTVGWIGAVDESRGISKLLSLDSFELGSSENLTLELEARVLKRGRVTDGSRPIPNATVMVLVRLRNDPFPDLQGRRQLQPVQVVTTDENGEFEAYAIPQNRVEVSVPGYASYHEELHSREWMNIQVHEIATVEGRVTGASHGYVTATQGEKRYRAALAANGSYSITDLGAGEWTLHATSLGKSGLSTHRERITLMPGELKKWNAHLQPTSCVHGRVVNAAGEPMAGVWVGAPATTGSASVRQAWQNASAWCLTDSEGQWALSCEPGATLDLAVGEQRVLHTAKLAGALGMSPELSPVEIQLASIDSALTGVFLDVDGQPVHGARIDARCTRFGLLASAVTREGAFELNGLGQGEVVIEVQRPGAPVLALTRVTLEEGEVLDLGSLREPLTGSLRVEFDHSAAKIQAWLIALDGGRTVVRASTTGGAGLHLGEGVVEAEQLYPGRYMIWVRAQGYSGVRRIVTVESGRQTLIHSPLGKATLVRVQTSLPEAFVEPSLATRSLRLDLTGPMGPYEFEKNVDPDRSLRDLMLTHMARGEYSGTVMLLQGDEVVAHAEVAFEVVGGKQDLEFELIESGR